MTVGASISTGLYEGSFFQNNQKNENVKGVSELPSQKETIQNDKKVQELQEEQDALASNPIGALSTEKIAKMVKDFETRLLEQMGYAPASVAKIKNLSESYRLELFAEMKKGFASQMQEDAVLASQTLSGLLAMPSNSRSYLQELLA